MFQMLTCFNLKEGVDLAELEAGLEAFAEEMIALDLCTGCGPVGHRRAESGLDTDAERDHGYFFLMDFRDRAQSEAAYAHIKRLGLMGVESHLDVIRKTRDTIFICWEHGCERRHSGKENSAPAHLSTEAPAR